MARQLAAILFSDIVGYTTMMRENEAATLELVRRSREIQQPLVEQYHGTWLKEMGDGALAQFQSALDAVKCAIEIQQVSANDLQAQLRIGIHLGDVTMENGEVYGDGINVASRIESVAEPGSIYISEAVQGAIKGSDIHTAFRGEKKLKNVDQPVRVYQVVAEPEAGYRALVPRKSHLPWVVGLLLVAALLLWKLPWKTTPLADKTIAVLPLQVQDADSANQELTQGITDELIRSLSKIRTLTVVNPYSTLQFMASAAPVREAAASLEDSDYFLTGSFERNNNLLKLDLALYDSHEQELWRNSYSDDLYRLPKLAGTVAVDLAEFIQVNLSESEATRIVEIPEVDPELFRLLLLGRNHLVKFTPQDIAIGLNYLQQAVNQYPASSRAWSMLAEGLVTMGHSPAPPPGVKEEAAAAATRALQLDSLNAEAWTWLATTKSYYSWDYHGAQYCYNKANTLNPNLPMSHYHYSWHLYLFDSLDKAVDEHRKAFRLDPLDPFQAARLAHIYLIAGKLDSAEMEVARALRLGPEFPLAHNIKGLIHLQKNEYDSAEMAFQGTGPMGTLGLGMVYLKTGRYQEGMRQIEMLKQNINAFNSFGLALLYAEMDSLDQFFEYANYQPIHAFHPWLRVEISNPKIIADPRFKQLMDKMNLPMPDLQNEPATTF